MDGTTHRAKSLPGFLAYHLGGESAFTAIKRHDDLFSDPGADDIQKLIGNQPTLILLDELVRWVAAARQLEAEQSQRAANGLRNALNAIGKAVANSPRAVMVITTPEEGVKGGEMGLLKKSSSVVAGAADPRVSTLCHPILPETILRRHQEIRYSSVSNAL